ncbi:MAG: cysteine desulfurase NifS [Candidatus Omnitrophica bacterium]|nr:cysteine desulfurase NifS [Candidatus Omnitrophota bacterium]
MNTVYVDNNATTCVDPLVLEEMLPFLKESYGNPSSMHTFGGAVAQHIEKARGCIATLLGAADPSEIVLTSCGTESNNAAIHAAVASLKERRHLITTRVEHPAVKNVFDYYEEQGYQVSRLSVDRKGRLNIDELHEALSEETALVSVMYANNETGVIFPIEEIGALVKKKGAFFHCDAVQAVGKIPLNLEKSTIDFLSLSGHKFHAPKGVGALYIRKGMPFRPFLIGGHQEHGRRGGTENVASIVGLGKACELAAAGMKKENTQVRILRNRLEEEILSCVDHTLLNGDKENRLPNTTNISFEYVEGEAILLMLDKYGICASSGSACTSGSLEPSHVLRAMGVPYTAAHGSVRFSLSRFNTNKEIDFIIKKVPEIIKTLREISPFSEKKAL